MPSGKLCCERQSNHHAQMYIQVAGGHKQLFYISKTFELVPGWYFILWSTDGGLMLFCSLSLTKKWILLFDINQRDTFLGNNCEINKKTTATARQQILNKQQLNYNSRGTVGSGVFCGPRHSHCCSNSWTTTTEELCFLWGLCREVINGTSLEFSSVVRRWPAGNVVSAEAEESPLLEAVTRKWLVDSVTDWEH
jgi:hypothetical protein